MRDFKVTAHVSDSWVKKNKIELFCIVAWIALCDRSIYICSHREKRFSFTSELSFSAVFEIWSLFSPPCWLYFVYHSLFCVLSSEKQGAHRPMGSFGFRGKSICGRGAQKRLSGEKIKLSPLKVCWRFHETETIINMQWHMHTSTMILEASSWIIKLPKVPFAHWEQKADAARMNHSDSVRIYGR